MAKKRRSDGSGGGEAAVSGGGIKKLAYGASILIALGGSVLLLIFTFLINDALDRTQALVQQNIADLDRDLLAIQGALEGAESELATANETLAGLGDSLLPLAQGLAETGSSVGGVADAMGSIPLMGQMPQLSGLRSASASLRDSSAKLNATAAIFSRHQENVAGMLAKTGELRASVSMQRATLAQTTAAMREIFGLVKIANLLFFVVVISMFAMLVMNSAAGLI